MGYRAGTGTRGGPARGTGRGVGLVRRSATEPCCGSRRRGRTSGRRRRCTMTSSTRCAPYPRRPVSDVVVHVAGTRSFAAEVIDFALDAGLTVAGLLEPYERERVGDEHPRAARVLARRRAGGGGATVLLGTGEPHRRELVARLTEAGWQPGSLVHPRGPRGAERRCGRGGPGRPRGGRGRALGNREVRHPRPRGAGGPSHAHRGVRHGGAERQRRRQHGGRRGRIRRHGRARVRDHFDGGDEGYRGHGGRRCKDVADGACQACPPESSRYARRRSGARGLRSSRRACPASAPS